MFNHWKRVFMQNDHISNIPLSHFLIKWVSTNWNFFTLFPCRIQYWLLYIQLIQMMSRASFHMIMQLSCPMVAWSPPFFFFLMTIFTVGARTHNHLKTKPNNSMGNLKRTMRSNQKPIQRALPSAFFVNIIITILKRCLLWCHHLLNNHS